jgi:UDP-galactopyranose mutase
MRKALIVGAGFGGAVYARELADAGFAVEVIDKREHIGGNCFDYVTDAGVRVHKYGPHLFHTSNRQVVDWLSQFTEWLPYEHRVVACLPDDRLVPMPVNLDTVNAVFGTDLQDADEVAAYLAGRTILRDKIASAEDHLFAKIGPELTDLFFRPYTKKMWGFDLSEMDAGVVRRLEIRTDRENRYFPNDSFQAMPAKGYTHLFERLFDHENIRMRLGTEFSHDMLPRYDVCFNSMPIDEFFDYKFGHLPYRSIRFHVKEVDADAASSHATINYTDLGSYTRETWWHNIPGHRQSDTGKVIRTIEEPCDYKDNAFERYYPVKTSDGRYDKIYEQYQALAKSNDRVLFIGRCGTYQYLDMHQVINQSLIGVRKWLKETTT